MSKIALVEAVRSYADANSPGWKHAIYKVEDQHGERLEFILIEHDRFTVLSRDEIAQCLPSHVQAP